MFGVRQLIPLLVASHRKLPVADFESIIRSCVIISYRYNVIGNLPPNEQEKLYQQIAQKISSGEHTSSASVIRELKPIYPSDDIFKTLFAEKILNTTNSRNAKIVRFTLAELENHLTGVSYDFASDRYSIEHVLPQNPETGWENFDDAEVDVMVYRLGNMALLETSINRDIANQPFNVKKPKLDGSVFNLTKNIANENSDWSAERIGVRQQSMATMAAATWRIDQLS